MVAFAFVTLAKPRQCLYLGNGFCLCLNVAVSRVMLALVKPKIHAFPKPVPVIDFCL